MKVKVIIEEVVSKVFEVEVGAIEDALQIAQAKYCAGEYAPRGCGTGKQATHPCLRISAR